MASTVDYMTTPDGSSIRYGVFRTGSAARKGTVVVLSGRNEFLEKYEETIGELKSRGFDVFSFDWRGQGLSSRMPENRQKGHILDYGVYAGDLDRFLRRVVLPAAAPPVSALAHSMGAHILLRYLAGKMPFITRAVLTSPMIDIYAGDFPVMFARMLTRAATALGGHRAYALGEGDYRPPGQRRFRRNRLTSDFRRYMDPHRWIARNPDLALGGVTYGWLRATFDSIDRLASPEFGASIRTPVLMVSSGADRVVPTAAQRALCRRLPCCRFVSIPGARHEILMEQDHFRAAFWRAFDDFMLPAPPKAAAASSPHSGPMASSTSQRA